MPRRRRSFKKKVTLKKGALGKFGYSTKISEPKRRASLRKAVKTDGRGTIVKRINVLRVFNKNKNPKLFKLLSRDMKYIQSLYP